MAEKPSRMGVRILEKQILLSRVFDAPRELVWKAWTDPQCVERWWGPAGFGTRVKELDLRVGGRSAYVMIGPDGSEYPVEGVFREIVPFERIVTTDDFGEEYRAASVEDLPEGIILTVLFEEVDEKRTRLTLELSHPNAEERRKHEEMGVVEGWGSSLDCLETELGRMA